MHAVFLLRGHRTVAEVVAENVHTVWVRLDPSRHSRDEQDPIIKRHRKKHAVGLVHED